VARKQRPHFVAKPADVVGLYMAPPENAIVICVDEKPSIQALERAQGYLKLANGRALTASTLMHSSIATTKTPRLSPGPRPKSTSAASKTAVPVNCDSGY
jgi:hypothetical protein